MAWETYTSFADEQKMDKKASAPQTKKYSVDGGLLKEETQLKRDEGTLLDSVEDRLKMQEALDIRENACRLLGLVRTAIYSKVHKGYVDALKRTPLEGFRNRGGFGNL